MDNFFSVSSFSPKNLEFENPDLRNNIKSWSEKQIKLKFYNFECKINFF